MTHDLEKRNDSSLWAQAKAREAVHLDELLEIAEDQKPGEGNRPDEKPEFHKEFAENGWRYKSAFFMDGDGKTYGSGKYYTVDMSVAYGEDGKARAYNIGSIRRRTDLNITGSSLAGAPRLRSSNNNLSNKNEDVNTSEYKDSEATTHDRNGFNLADAERAFNGAATAQETESEAGERNDAPFQLLDGGSIISRYSRRTWTETDKGKLHG